MSKHHGLRENFVVSDITGVWVVDIYLLSSWHWQLEFSENLHAVINSQVKKMTRAIQIQGR